MSRRDDVEITTRTFPPLDTGIGREAGYASDVDLIEAAEAQRQAIRAMVAPDVWARVEAAEAEMQRRFFFGDLP